jgi:hypothetical protein
MATFTVNVILLESHVFLENRLACLRAKFTITPESIIRSTPACYRYHLPAGPPAPPCDLYVSGESHP